MSTEEASTWNILPKHFVNCNNLDKYFSSNHRILSNKEIPLCYEEIHIQFMKYFKQEPTNLLDILNQSIWYNNWIKTGKNYLISNRLEHKGISKIKYILHEKCDFIDQSKINLKYKVTISFLKLQISLHAYENHGKKS